METATFVRAKPILVVLLSFSLTIMSPCMPKNKELISLWDVAGHSVLQSDYWIVFWTSFHKFWPMTSSNLAITSIHISWKWDHQSRIFVKPK